MWLCRQHWESLLPIQPGLHSPAPRAGAFLTRINPGLAAEGDLRYHQPRTLVPALFPMTVYLPGGHRREQARFPRQAAVRVAVGSAHTTQLLPVLQVVWAQRARVSQQK